jgi:hypothetical protein
MRAVQALVIAFAALFVACVADEPPESTTASPILAPNMIALNRIALNRIALNRIALNRIALNRIALNTITTQDLLSTSENREVLSYLVSCAFPASVTLVGTVNGTTYEFPGSIGLAPRWADRRLNSAEKGWISACMLARVNAYGVSLLISLRGAHPALTVSAEEAALYTVEEGAFYGDIFTPGDDPIVAISCRGSGQAAGESGGLVNRDCAEPGEIPGQSICGMTYAGDCGDYTTGSGSYACEVRHGDEADGDCDDDEDGDDQPGDSDDGAAAGYYTKCHSTSTTGHWPHSSVRYDQVITVYVSPAAPAPS